MIQRRPDEENGTGGIALPELPVTAVLPDVAAALSAPPHRAVLVAPPGAGKTTLVPLHLLASLPPGRILLAEPRRVATRAAASRMAQILGEPPGRTVGWRMRLDTRVSDATRIEVVTEGVLTRLLLADPELSGISALVFDEFHERSLDADLGLALALEAAGALRPDLRILVMSATLDGARVAQLLGEAPVIRSQGRAFPVEIRHRTPEAGTRVENEVARTVLDELAAGAGSILAFLPGAFEIERTAEALRGRLPADTMLCPLYAALPPAAQDEAIRPAPEGRRKVVLATTIAETSITIDGVTTVIDSGLKRQPRFEPSTGLQRLETVRVSLASADQRAGRAGRTAPGTAIRLWRAEQTGALQPFDRPEILSADLSGLTLDAVSWGVRSPAELPFLDPPPAAALAEAAALLRELGALDGDGRLTAMGEAMRQLPIAPRLARMVAGVASGEARNLAARLAVLLSEHGLGGTSADLAERLRRWRSEEGGRAREATALARRIAASVLEGDIRPQADEADPATLLALAYPDRIAIPRGAPGQFVLSNGRGARIDERDALARVPALVVADLGEGENAQARVGTVRAAAVLDRDALDAILSARAVDEDAVVFDAASRSVRGRRRRRLGRAVLSEQPIALPAGDAVGRALMEGVRGLGLRALPVDGETERLLRRMRFVAAVEPDWPMLDDDALLAGLETWLLPFVPGATSLGQITAGQLRTGLQSLVPPGTRLEALAPAQFVAPTGHAHPIRYEEDGPVLSIRVQELFGLRSHPSVAGGRLPLTLELVSPAGRPIQITRDLPAFWAGSWRDVRADLRGRYPRHPWPEDPASAAPTARAKPRT